MNTVHIKGLRKKSQFKVQDKLVSFINKNISKAEFEVEVALEEIVNDLIKRVPNISVKNIKIFKEHDDMGPYYKAKIVTKINDKNN